MNGSRNDVLVFLYSEWTEFLKTGVKGHFKGVSLKLKVAGDSFVLKTRSNFLKISDRCCLMRYFMNKNE